MKLIPLLTLSSLVTFASAKFFVVNGPSYSRDAARTCEKNGGKLARLHSGKRGNIHSATRALYKARVHDAWIHSVNKRRHSHRLYLRKPDNFKTTNHDGQIIEAACDSDMVCNDLKPVLCYKKGHDGKRKKKHHRHHNRHSSSSSSSSTSSGYSDDSWSSQQVYYQPPSNCQGADCPIESEQQYDFGDNYQEPVYRPAQKRQSSYY